MQQYIVEEFIETGKEIELSQEQAHHIQDVLRMKEGSIIRLVFPLEKQAAFGKISMHGKKVVAYIDEMDNERHELPCRITLCIGLIRKEKWEYILQKATELGVDTIVPFISQRTVVKSKEEKWTNKKDRWNKIVLEAMEQSKRESLPRIEDVCKFKDLSKYQSELNCVGYENIAQTGKSLRSLVQSQMSISVVIGPEGGFAEEEIQYLTELGYHCISLGKRILRAETAACHVLSVISGLVE
ncbi:MAG: RsmE family RNA methyltransferase [Anaerorhabdus sp.]